MTYAADWFPNATRAQRALWDLGTPWLIGVLGPATVATTHTCLFHARMR